MKGRGTRVLSSTDLQAVSGADARAKAHFIIVDAVGVCESDKTDSRRSRRSPPSPWTSSCSALPSANATKTPTLLSQDALPGLNGGRIKRKARHSKPRGR